ncbi:MAG: VanZ family protein [Solobacterium sp.]|nr:VanZ family protein [Solobacterium sp.]MCH4221781.1 VanZ family protein [Solobacterium sp.]MCH4266598.1 VanZ family protein [Solobacterium sp.]
MTSYLSSIKTAIVAFPLLAAVITLPFILYQYHHYGSIHWMRVLIVYAFIFYMLAAYFLIILPLPDKSNLSLFSFEKHFEPMPFNNTIEYFQKHPFDGTLSSLLKFFKSFSFLQLAFNTLMTVPFGIFLRYYFKYSLKKTVLFSFLLSLFYELTQLSGLYGYYPAPYRTFDADDLICNTLGGTIGWVIAPIFTFFLPSRRHLDSQSIARSVNVSFLRRAAADSVDFLLYLLVYSAFQLILLQFNLHLSGDYAMDLFLLIMWLYALLGHGVSPGKIICNLQVAGSDQKPASFWKITLRYGLLALLFASVTLSASAGQSTGILQTVLDLINLLSVIVWVIFFGEIILRIFKPQHPYWYEKISRTMIVSTIDPGKKEPLPE